MSRTKLVFGGIFSLPVSSPFFKKLFYQTFFTGTSKRSNRVRGDRYDPSGGAFHHPFQGRVWTDAELLSNH